MGTVGSVGPVNWLFRPLWGAHKEPSGQFRAYYLENVRPDSLNASFDKVLESTRVISLISGCTCHCGYALIQKGFSCLEILHLRGFVVSEKRHHSTPKRLGRDFAGLIEFQACKKN